MFLGPPPLNWIEVDVLLTEYLRLGNVLYIPVIFINRFGCGIIRRHCGGREIFVEPLRRTGRSDICILFPRGHSRSAGQLRYNLHDLSTSAQCIAIYTAYRE